MSDETDFLQSVAESAQLPSESEETAQHESVPQAERAGILRNCEEEIRLLEPFSTALAASEKETACARFLRDELSVMSTTRMEAFRVSPMAGRNSSLLMAAAYFVAVLFYFFSFAGDRTAGIVLTAVSLVILFVGGFVTGAMFLGSRRFVGILPGKVAYNVFSENFPSRKQQGSKLLVIAANRDAVPGSYFTNFALVRKTVFAVVPSSVVLMVLFCVIKMAVGSDTVAKITLLTVFPFITSVAGIAALALHFSPFSRHARANNGISTSVAINLYRYLSRHPELLPEDMRVCFVSFGAENAAHAGSRAFAAAHPEIKGAKAVVLGDIESASFRLERKDLLRKITLSRSSLSVMGKAVERSGVACELHPKEGLAGKLNAMHGYAASALAEAGCDCVFLTAKDYTEKNGTSDKEPMGELFALALAAAVAATEE